MSLVIEALQKQLDTLEQTFFDHNSRTWKDADGFPASPELTLGYQKQVRALRFQIQEVEEVSRSLSPETPFDLRKLLAALVSRRKNRGLWHFIAKEKSDGDNFQFEPTELHDVCGCSNDQLEEQYCAGTVPSNFFYLPDETTQGMLDRLPSSVERAVVIITALRDLHNDLLVAISNGTAGNRSSLCPNPKPVPTRHHYQHSIGNIHCRACFVTGEPADFLTADKVSTASQQCPNFLGALRTLSMPDYVQALGPKFGQQTDQTVRCYAGLLHSELSRGEKDCCGCTDEQLKKYYQDDIDGIQNKCLDGYAGALSVKMIDLEAQLPVGYAEYAEGYIRAHHNNGNCPNPVVKHFIRITKKCDTCSFIEHIDKEIVLPEQIKEGELLGVAE